MARWALIVEDRVREIFVGEERPKLHESLQLVDVTEQPQVQEGFGYAGDVFSPPVSQIAILRERAKAAVDAAAERARLQFITPGAGQAMTYICKLDEARAQQAGDPGPFPLLQASVGIEGPDVATVATTVIAMANLWIGAAAQIEAARLGAKNAIDAVPDDVNAAEAISAIVLACEWPSP